jgi:transposase
MGDPLCPDCQEFSRKLAERDKRIEELEGLRALLEYDLKELRSERFKRRKKKAKEKDKRAGKKRGAPLGHRGWFRKKPERIDVTEEVTLDHCPQCGSRDLSECREIEEHIQEDIVLPKLKVTRYRRHHYYCKGCKEVVSGRGKEEIPNSYIGPQAKAVAAFLKYRIKVSQRDIQTIFKQLCGLRIVPSSIPGFHNQLCKRSLSLYEGLKEQIQQAPWIHADETGTRLDGNPHWDWVFATVHICLHVIDKSRGQKVVEETLGKRYDGVLISALITGWRPRPSSGVWSTSCGT